MKFTLLHLADLHCAMEDSNYLERVSTELCKDLIANRPIFGSPNLVCVTGDLVSKGENGSDEFRMAKTIFLDPIKDTINANDTQFFFVPGNHDVDRSKISKSFEAGLSTELTNEGLLRQFQHRCKPKTPDHIYLEEKLSSYYSFVRQYKNDAQIVSSLFCDAYVLQMSGLKIGIAAFNTSWRCSQFGSDDGRLLVGESIIGDVSEKLIDCDLRIAMCHHPIEMLAPFDRKPTKRKLGQHFSLLLNGHVHDSDSALNQELLGNLFVSTAGCLKANDPFASYSVIELDLQQNKVTFHFRKWYPERGQFDQETAKIANGKMSFCGLKPVSDTVAAAIQIATIRGELQDEVSSGELVCPLEGLDSVDLSDVFVEPLLTDRSTFEQDIEDRRILDLDQMVKGGKNLLFAGRPEFGKSTILRHIKEYVLRHDKHFDAQIPVLIRFSDIPTTDLKGLLRFIAKRIRHGQIDAEHYAREGNLMLIIDDYNDHREVKYKVKSDSLRTMFKTYPKCRYILSSTEQFSPSLQLELATIANELNAERVFIASLNSARVRKLLSKWSAKQSFDVDQMLHSILHYFWHCQIPVTPLAVVLFLGVLFKRKLERNIRNEAHLIENYLETILDKLNPTLGETDLIFHDQVDFLAALAWQILMSGGRRLDVTSYEHFKLNYFETQDEDLPPHSFFEAFFRKGILFKEDGTVRFSRNLWFNFFLAKVMEGDPSLEEALLQRSDFLKYRKALAYKAGLTRKEVGLLKVVDDMVMKEASPLLEKYGLRELRQSGKGAPLHELSEAISRDIRERNSDEAVDRRRDEVLLNYEEDKGSVEDDQIEMFGDLLSLQSDIIRNTSKSLGPAKKREFIDHNVSCYAAMMWAVLESFREVFQHADEDELVKLFFRGRKNASIQHKLQVVAEHAQRMIHQLVPVSVLIYLSEHLGNPKLVRSFRTLAASAQTETKRLFYKLLLFAQSPREGLKLLRQTVSGNSEIVEDYVITGFLRWYCYENKLDDDLLDRIIEVIDTVRSKYAKRIKDDHLLLRDTFKSDLKQQLRARQFNS